MSRPGTEGASYQGLHEQELPVPWTIAAPGTSLTASPLQLWVQVGA